MADKKDQQFSSLEKLAAHRVSDIQYGIIYGCRCFLVTNLQDVGNETLIQSPNCGYLYQADLKDASRATFFGMMEVESRSKLHKDILIATAYFRACYDNLQGGPQCYQFSKSTVTWQESQNRPCPFGDSIC